MNKSFISGCILFLLLLFVFKTHAQDYAALQYTTEDGLPSNNIYNIHKDRHGYLWICTDKGIARYNGLNFETFTTFDGLPDNEIFFFYEDYKDRLWLGTFNGELCYYKDGRFYTEANAPFLNLPFKKSFINHIRTNYDSSVLIGFPDHQKWINVDDNNITIYNFEKLIPSGDLAFLYINKIPGNKFEIELADKKVFIDSHGNILREQQRRNNRKYKYSRSPNQSYFYTADSIYNLNEEPLAAMNKDVYYKTELYHLHSFNGNFFYCTDKGLFINNDEHLFRDHKVSGCEEDNEGNLWISTLDGGLYSMSKDFMTIKKYRHGYEGQVKYSAADSDYLYFVTNRNRLHRFAQGNRQVLFDYPEYTGRTKSTSGQANLIDRSHNYYGIFDSTIVVVSSIHSVAPIVKTYYANFLNGSKAIFTSQGYVYLKLIHSIERIDLSKSTPVWNEKNKYTLQSKRSGSIDNTERIFSMAQAPDNTLWYSTIDSIYQIKTGQGTAQPQFRHLSFRWFDIIGDYLIGCTHDNKLAVCNNTTQGLYFDVIENQNCIWNKLYKLDATHVLLSTNNLYRILTLAPSQNKPAYTIQAVENPYIPTGVEDISSNGTTCFFLKDGSITSVDINSLVQKPNPPLLSFKELKAGKKTYPIGNDIEIPFSESKNISISYSTLSLSARHITYQYTLSKSGDDNWTDLSGDINLLHPGFGDYIIKIRAKSISSDYSEPVIFTMHILRPFWATWWFIAMITCFAVFMIAFIIRRRTLSMLHKKQTAHEKEIRFIKSEYKALNALMNPHFIFNTLNNVQDLINKNDKRAANEYLRYFADLIRQNMQNISKEMIPLQKEVDLVTNYLLLEKLRFEDSLNYSIEIDEQLDLSEIMVPPLLIQPLVENSIKHGIYPQESPDGYIRIRIYERDDTVYIEVMDNGIGISQSKNKVASSHESFGMESIRKRIGQLSMIQEKEFGLSAGNVKNENDGKQWTVVTVSIPVPEYNP